MKHLLVLSISLVLVIFRFTSAIGQSHDLPPNAKAGHCYAKVLIGSSTIVKSNKTLPIYIGNDSKVKTKTIQIALEYENGKWVKKPNPDCKSSAQQDCMVWCWEKEGQDIFEIVTVAKKPNKVPPSDLDYQTFDVVSQKTKGGITEWREVICSHQITPIVIEKIINALKLDGYTIPASERNQLGGTTKKALVSYQ